MLTGQRTAEPPRRRANIHPRAILLQLVAVIAGHVDVHGKLLVDLLVPAQQSRTQALVDGQAPRFDSEGMNQWRKAVDEAADAMPYGIARGADGLNDVHAATQVVQPHSPEALGPQQGLQGILVAP